MDYLLAILLPPVAVLLKGKPGQAVLNLVLTLCFWVPGMIHAILVVNNAHADKRNKQLIKAMNNQNRR
ncbi:MAG: YqaE/Pmp3 family membrane protein [Thermomicrobiales bacterium]